MTPVRLFILAVALSVGLPLLILSMAGAPW